MIHRDLHIQTGDTVEVDGAVGTVTHVNLKWDKSGHYGNRASYKVDGYIWVRDSQVTGIVERII